MGKVSRHHSVLCSSDSITASLGVQIRARPEEVRVDRGRRQEAQLHRYSSACGLHVEKHSHEAHAFHFDTFDRTVAVYKS